jgi:hypothetical protein
MSELEANGGGGPGAELTPLPATRELPAVLRRLLAPQPAATEIVVGKVTAVPDARHVEVEIQGVRSVVPRIAGYAPTVGEGCFCLSGASIVVALGAVGGATPSTPVAPGSAVNQVLVWNGSAWVAANAVPQATNATNAAQLAGASSATYLQHVLAGAHKVWWGHYGLVGVDVSWQVTVPHLLGATPAAILVTPRIGGPDLDGVSSWDASNIVLLFTGPGSVEGWVFAIV